MLTLLMNALVDRIVKALRDLADAVTPRPAPIPIPIPIRSPQPRRERR
ncbi:MAG TPA: hypothetical protein VKY74_02290 [Chloroflexia bacterium]|nr:hypothetical protein [Chloroflexia bacterium]